MRRVSYIVQFLTLIAFGMVLIVASSCAPIHLAKAPSAQVTK